jgi:hypothetical protein
LLNSFADARRAARAQARFEEAKAITFKQCAEAYINSHRAGWRNGKHAGQWSATLATYAFPLIGDLPVHGVDTGLVLSRPMDTWANFCEQPNSAGKIIPISRQA